MNAPTDLPAAEQEPDWERTDTGGMTALADAVRERRGAGPAPGAPLATMPATRLQEITGALHGAADLVARWREDAEEMRAQAPRGLRGIRHRLWADALEAAADDLLIVVEPARRVRRPDVVGLLPSPRQPSPAVSLKEALVATVSRVVSAHAGLPVPVRAARASRFPFDIAQAVVDVVAPASYARALARARGLLIERGDLEAAAALAELEEGR